MLDQTIVVANTCSHASVAFAIEREGSRLRPTTMLICSCVDCGLVLESRNMVRGERFTQRKAD